MIESKGILAIINAFLVGIALLFFLDVITSLEIHHQPTKEFVYWGFILLPPVAFLANLIYQKKRISRISFSLLSAALLVLMIVLDPVDIVFSSSAWKTQTVLYEHEKDGDKRIEFQLQDVGSLGYNRRTVIVTDFLYIFRLVQPYDDSKEPGADWVRVDRALKQQDLKGG